MFQQLLTPVGDSLGLSFIVAILPDRRRAGAARRCCAGRHGRRPWPVSSLAW